MIAFSFGVKIVYSFVDWIPEAERIALRNIKKTKKESEECHS